MARPKIITRKLKDVALSDVLDDYREQKMGLEQIAAELGCSVQTLVRNARDEGYEPVTYRLLERVR